MMTIRQPANPIHPLQVLFLATVPPFSPWLSLLDAHSRAYGASCATLRLSSLDGALEEAAQNDGPPL
jgi:hypothetical protein